MRQRYKVVAPTVVKQVKRYPFRKAILNDCGGDLSKRWYIEYYIWNIDYQKLKRVREYSGFKDFQTDKGRRIYAKKRIREINSNLAYCAIMEMPYPGYLQEQERLHAQKEQFVQRYTLKSALDFIVPISYPETRNKKTRSTMDHIAADFVSFCAKRGIPDHDINLIKKVHAQTYVDYMSTEMDYHANTVINKYAKTKALFSKLEAREIIKSNPFSKLELPKAVITTRNEAFTEIEQQKIKKTAIEVNPPLWSIIQTIYYCYIRTTEMQKLRIENILLDSQKIFIPGTISKNGKAEHVVIPDPLIKQFEKMELHKYPSDYYLYGKNGIPGATKMPSNWIGNSHKKILDDLKITGKTFYSWKHTGVVEAYKSGIDLKSIQMQCRHASIEQTDQYLKSLGFHDNVAFMKGVRQL